MEGRIGLKPASRKALLPLEERCVLYLIVLMASWFVVATGCTALGLSFKTLCWVFSFALPVCFILIKRFSLDRTDAHESPDPTPVAVRIMLFLLCMLGASLGFLEHFNIPDDGYYFSGRTVYYLANPDASLDLNHHNHALLAWPVRYPLVLLQSISLLWAYIALLTGSTGLGVVHFVAPTIGGFFLPIVCYLALKRFVKNPLAAIVGAAAILAFLSLDGITRRSYGFFLFVRLRHGKVFLMSVLIPLFIAYSRDWFSRPSWRHATMLVLVSLAGAASSDSTLFMMPMLAVFLATGCLFSEGISKAVLKKLVGYFTSMIFLYIIGVYLLATMDRSAMDYIGFETFGEGTDFAAHFRFVFAQWPHPFFALYLLATGVTWLGLDKKSDRRFLLGWSVAAVVILNPLLFGFITTNLTTSNAYWRLFYLLPFRVTIGLAPAVLLARATWFRTPIAIGAMIAFLSLAFVGHQIDFLHKIVVFQRVPMSISGYKIRETVRSDVELMITRAMPGAMVAPRLYSAVVPLYTHEFPQVSVRGYLLSHSAIAHGQPKLADSRLLAIDYLSGEEAGVQDLKLLLANEGLKNVVASSSCANRPQFQRLMKKHAFTRVLKETRFSLFVRG